MTDIRVLEEGVAVASLTSGQQKFLISNGFLGHEPGDEAAAIMVDLGRAQFAQVVGAACPNSQRRAFPGLVASDEGNSFRMMGTTAFVTAPHPMDPESRVVFFNWDRRTGENGIYCATSEGGVAGGRTYRYGMWNELADELYLVGVLGGKVVRVVPRGFPYHLHGEPGVKPNPFGVALEDAVECGTLDLAGYHDNQDGGWLSAVYTWFYPGAARMTPLFAFSRGTYNLAWQDAAIPILGSTSHARARVQGILTAFPLDPILRGEPLNRVPSVGKFAGTQGFMPEDGALDGVRPGFHPSAVRWAQLMAASSRGD